jgi:ribonucleoside-triphosphate reductase
MENEKFFNSILKRNGLKETFNPKKIAKAIEKAGNSTGEFGKDVADKLTLKTLSILHSTIKDKIPSVEEIQDIVEEVLLFVIDFLTVD